MHEQCKKFQMNSSQTLSCIRYLIHHIHFIDDNIFYSTTVIFPWRLEKLLEKVKWCSEFQKYELSKFSSKPTQQDERTESVTCSCSENTRTADNSFLDRVKIFLEKMVFSSPEGTVTHHITIKVNDAINKKNKSVTRDKNQKIAINIVVLLHMEVTIGKETNKVT